MIAQSDSGALCRANEASPAVGGGVLAARLAQGCGPAGGRRPKMEGEEKTKQASIFNAEKGSL